MNIYSMIKEGQHSLSYIHEYYSTEEEAQKVADHLKAEGKFEKITKEGNEYAVWAFYEPQTKAESEEDYMEDYMDEDSLACCMCGRIIDNPADACVEDDTDPYPDVYCADCWNERFTTEKEDSKPFIKNKATGETLTKAEVKDRWEDQKSQENPDGSEDYEYPFEKYLSDIDETGEWEFLKEAFVLPNVNQLVEEINKYVPAEPIEDEEGITIKVMEGLLKIDQDGIINFTADWLTDVNNSLTFRAVEDFLTAVQTLAEAFK